MVYFLYLLFIYILSQQTVSELLRDSSTYIPRFQKHDVNQAWMGKGCDLSRTCQYTPY